MAQGGACDEGVLDQGDCSICFDPMSDKEPRLLSCGHTFCTPCLQKLTLGRKNTLPCPRCRKFTQLPPEGVAKLPVNFDLKHLLEMETMLITRQKEKEQDLVKRCQNCSRNAEVEYFCNTCSKGLICRMCAIKHNDMPALRNHKVMPIQSENDPEPVSRSCSIHDEPITSYCQYCHLMLCPSCMFRGDHGEHPDKVVDIKDEIMYTKQENTNMSQSLKKSKNKTQQCCNVISETLESVTTAKQEIQTEYQMLKTMLLKVKYQILLADKLEMSLSSLQKQFVEQKNKLEVQQEHLVDENDEYIKLSRSWQDKAQVMVEKTTDLLHQTIPSINFIQGDLKVTGNISEIQVENVKISSCLVENKSVTFELPPLATSIEPTFYNKINILSDLELSEIISVGDGSLLTVDRLQNYVQRLDESGQEVERYTAKNKHKIFSASVCEDYMYLTPGGADKEGTKINMDDRKSTKFTLPTKKNYNISAVEENLIFLSECTEDGKILQYSDDSIKVPQISYPSKVVVTPAGEKKHYAVMWDEDVNTIINIYNSEWTLLHQVKDIPTTTAIAASPGGDLLVATRNRLFLCSTEGKVIKELVCLDEEYSIVDIAVDLSFLWLLCKNKRDYNFILTYKI